MKRVVNKLENSKVEVVCDVETKVWKEAQEKAFEKLMEQFNSLRFNKKDARSYLRTQLATTSELEIDKAGRVIIPNTLLEKYSISKSVMVIGMGDHIEVWDSKAYEIYEAEADKNFETIAENLNKDD